MTRFVCASCGSRLTTAVETLTDTARLFDRDTASFDETAGTAYLPEGVYFVATETTNPREYDVGNFIVNIQSAPGTVMSNNHSRTAGCCGLDGLDGPNVVCENGHEVGTQRSDCWTLHYVAFHPELVEMVEG
ncbi:hypothetical protein [Haladaptatus sp. CMSO5]|uniref:hypothetical protein n=1 Tax=Haladaptatus sp. CMSO5 TaxID=3120514 RepID=UPI002FCE612B